ncbi:MAG: hypothetical protein HFI09_02990, partial [Bacilli bacterium]|nr:hypothetical protein [Bacilli bacterium]
VLFVYSSGKRLYNIFVSENFYKIDEWQKMDKISVEKVIMVDLMTRKYYYSSMKHNEFGSTIFTRSFSNNPVDVSDLDLTAQEAYQDIQQLIGNLLDITGIENVMNWAEFYEIIYEGISSKIGSKNERKRVHFSRNHYEYLNVNL